MRRVLLLCLVILELGIAGMLVRLGGQLPARGEVETSFAKAKKVTGHAGEEIQHIRNQVDMLRRPDMQKMAVKLQGQLQVVTKMLHDRKVDFDTVTAVRDGLGGVADGLMLFAKTLDAGHLDQMAEGLGTTADFLDQKLLPVAATIGQQLEKSTDALAKDLAAVLKDTGKLEGVAKALRKAQQELRASAKNWPSLKKTILGSASLLQATRLQLDQALQQRKHYENAVEQTAHLGEGFAAMLPLLSEQMVMQLDEQDRSLYGLSQSLAEVGDSMASYGEIGGRLVATVRMLVWLMALLVTLHAIYRCAGLWKRARAA